MNREPQLTTNHFAILNKFSDGFEYIHSHMEKKYQTALLEHTPLLFQKWCFAALSEGTILSPANIFGYLAQKNGTAQQQVVGYALQTNPRKKGTEKFSFYCNVYSLSNHPLVSDLETLLHFCLPDVAVTQDGFLSPEDEKKLAKKLSLQDPFYVAYLTSLAWKNNLLKYLPAIHSKRVQPSKQSTSFLAQPTDVILKTLLSSTYEIASEKFCTTLEADPGFFPPSLFASYFEDGKEIDAIFKDIFSFIEIDIDDFLGKDPAESLSPQDSAIFSSFYIVGVLLDQWVLSPLAFFYRFIEPISFSSISFLNLLNRMTTHLVMGHDTAAEIFAPPADYYFTPLGSAIMKPLIPRENIHELPEKLNFADIETGITNSQTEAAILDEMVMDAFMNLPIYTFRVSFSQKKSLWKLVEINGETTLDVFCNTLATLMGFELEPNYVLTLLDKNGFPIHYTSKQTRKSFHKAENITLEELDLTPSFSMSLQNGQDPSDTLNIKFEGEGKPTPYTIYPRLKRQSAEFFIEENDYLL